MKYISEFRNSDIVRKLSEKLNNINLPRNVNFMEVCGTHTMSIYRNGIKSLLPSYIKLVSGPGCPVCVSEITYIDKAVALSQNSDVITCTFGDLIKVPGSESSLEKEKAKGSDIRVVYSPLDALNIAKENPDKYVVFLGVGFETTAPTIASTIIEAYEIGQSNFSILASHKTMPEPMKALLDTEDIQIDGFICPAHVSAVIGTKPYEFIPRDYRKPAVITGFEPVDVLQGILKLVLQIKEDKPAVENQYYRVVKEEGNLKMQEIVKEVFEKCDANWRGIGIIPDSGLKINGKYAEYDAELRFDIKPCEPKEYKACICGEVITGKKHPSECPLFGKVCNPEEPKGACMVSSEGSCSAYFKYGDHQYR
jgi:hydrogenase expression/formation protein HypD